MSRASEMLSRLDGTSTYADLQNVFSQLTAEAEASRENPELASQIDEVIDRLIRERARDEREMNDVQSRYESFREQNRGVVGWFKRHLPFTETRRQELNHQEDIADQSAEILADNVVIARAQMLKERLLPPDRRRLGRRVDDWHSQWEKSRTRATSAAQVILQLHQELGPSQEFLAELQKDISAFAQAKFREEADVQRRDADRIAAESELEVLKREVESEIALKTTSLGLLAGHVAAELEAIDSQFRHDGQKLERLNMAMARLTESRTAFGKLTETVAQLAAIIKQLHSLPDEIQQSRQTMARIDGERSGAGQVVAAKNQVVQERQTRHAELQRDVDVAKQTLASLQSSYDSYQAQRAASATMPQAVEAEPLAPIAQQYQQARAAVDQAQLRLQEGQLSLDVARKEAAQAQADLQSLEEKFAAERKKLTDLENKEPQLRSEMTSVSNRGQSEFATAASMFAGYLQTDRSNAEIPDYRPDEIGAGTFGFLSTRGLDHTFATVLFQSGTNVTRHAQASATLERVVQWQDSQSKHIEQQRNQLRGRRESIWKRHCAELLGDALAEEACKEGLASTKT